MNKQYGIIVENTPIEETFFLNINSTHNMKAPKHIAAYLFAAVTAAALSFTSHSAEAQGIKKTAEKVGNKTASIAVKGTSAVTDKIYKGKEGPNGETVYIDKKDRKFIVDDKGKKVYLKKSQIHNKKKD